METHRSILEALADGTISAEEALKSMQGSTQPMDLCVDVCAGERRKQKVHLRIPYSLLQWAVSRVEPFADEDSLQWMELLDNPAVMQDGLQITVDDEDRQETVHVTLKAAEPVREN